MQMNEPGMKDELRRPTMLLITGTMPLAMLFFGPLANEVAIEGILVVTGALLAGLGLVFDRYKYEGTGDRETVC